MSFPEDTSSENIVHGGENSVLKSCGTCGRTFNPKSLERHEKICEKTKMCNQRTVFNSFLQRAKEIGATPVKPEAKAKESTKTKKKWREEHDSLMRVVRLGKNFSGGELLNNGLSPQKTIPPGYEQCPSCERYFSEKAADRHISFCQEQRNRLPKTPTNTVAMERLKARVKYRAPLPKKRNHNDQRLVKSAESVRESSSFRTHSSSSPSSREVKLPRRRTSALPRQQLPDLPLDKNANFSASNTNNNNSESDSSYENINNSKTKKAVKFKEMFPVYDKEKNRNLDMLAALRLRLSELSASDNLIEDCILRSESSSQLQNHSSKMLGLPDEDGDPPLSLSFSAGSLHRSLDQPLPRFCYNCGTKYPIASAKFCCECGAQRFFYSALSDTRLSVP